MSVTTMKTRKNRETRKKIKETRTCRDKKKLVETKK